MKTLCPRTGRRHGSLCTKGENNMSKFLLAVCVLGLLFSSASAREDTEDELKEGMQKYEFTRHVSSGKKQILEFVYGAYADCSPHDVEVKTTLEPEHGSIEAVPGDRFPSFKKENARFKCNDKKIRGVIVNYKSRGGYVGSDKFELLILYPGGFAREIRYNVNVR